MSSQFQSQRANIYVKNQGVRFGAIIEMHQVMEVRTWVVSPGKNLHRHTHVMSGHAEYLKPKKKEQDGIYYE